MVNTAIEDDNGLLDCLIKDMNNQCNPLYKPGPYWAHYTERMLAEIKKEGLKDFRRNINISKGFADATYLDPFELVRNTQSIKSKIYSYVPKLPLLKKYYTKRYLLELESWQKHAFSYRSKYFSLLFGDLYASMKQKIGKIDSCIGNPSNVVTIDGDVFGMSYFQAMLRIASFSKVVDFNRCTTLFEIGGGFGSTTDLILKLYPNIRKVVYLDIPPTLYIGTQYLKSIYGKSVSDYNDTKHLSRIEFDDMDKLEILCLAPWQIDKLDVKVDLFYNSESFQEMTVETIQNYCKYLSKLVSKERGNVCLWFYADYGVKNTVTPLLLKLFRQRCRRRWGLILNYSSPRTVLLNRCGCTEVPIHESPLR